MPWPPQQRVSPSGPFAPAPGDLDGFVRRIFYDRNNAQVAIDEGGAMTGGIVCDVPIVIAADDDLPNLRWVAEADVRYTIAATAIEDPRLFPVSMVLGLQAPGAPTPTAVLVTESWGWPWFPDEDNSSPQNVGVIRHAWDVTTYAPWAVGTNHATLHLVFFGAGAHQAIVDTQRGSLVVREYRGPSLAVS